MRAGKIAVLGALGSGALLAGSLPPQGVPALMFVALTPLLWALLDVRSWRFGFRLGLIAGTVMMAAGYPWFVEMFQVFAELPLVVSLLLYALFCVYSAVPIAAWSAVLVVLPRGRGWALAAAFGFTGLWWSWPMVFPFTVTLGLAAQPVWIQSAELGGAAMVEILVVLCSALLAEAASLRGAARWRRAALALMIPALCLGLGHWRMRSLDDETTRTIRFGLVQPNIPLLWDDKQARLARLREPSAQAQADGAEIVVWPENMYPWPLDRPLLRDFTDEDRILRLHALPTLFGAGSIADDDAYGHNTVFNMGADGRVHGSFDKVHLVPFGEYIPLVDPVWATAQVAGMAHNFAGEGPARFEVVPGPVGSTAPPVSLGPLICYEDMFAGFAREVAAQPGGIEVFVNLSNDTWFGAMSEAWEHLAVAQFRSVEHRVPMVRSVNSGPSSAIDRAGRISASTTQRRAAIDALVAPEVLVAEVAIGRDTATAPTLFARGGWLLVHLCQLIAGGLLALAWFRKSKRT